MKLKNNTTLEELSLPNDLLWEDEFDWSSVLSDQAHTTTGALIIDQWVKQAGRPISLRPADDEMAWVPRSTASKLVEWANTTNTTFTLEFEYPTDTRTFTVIFDTSKDQPVKAVPVAGFPGHRLEDWFRVSMQFIEV